jgi:hypothetical protein
MAATATNAGAGNVARKIDVPQEPKRRVWICCECQKPHTEVYGSWENGNVSVCSKTCNTAKTAREQARPHYWPADAKPQLRVV